MSCCVEQTNGAPPGGGGGAVVQRREFEIDWGAQGDRALTNGPENITTTDGDVLVVTSQIAALESNTLTSGAGAVWVEGTNLTEWDSTARTATALYIPWLSIYQLLDSDATWRYRIESYYSVLSLINTEYTITGLDGVAGTPSNAATRLCASGRSRQGGTQVWRPAAQAGGVNYTTAPASAVNVSGVVVDAQAISAIGGEWTGDWDSYRARLQWGVGKLADAGLSAPMLDQNTRVVFTANAGPSALAGSTLTLARTRVQAIGFAV